MGTGLATEIIGLPPYIFCHCDSSWNKHQANRILNHLILARRKTLWLPLAFEPLKGSPNEEIQYNE